MAYGTLAEYVEFARSQEVAMQTNWDSDEVFINDDFAQMHLDLAAARIDATIGKLYDLPITPAPPVLKWIQFRITHHECEMMNGEIRPAIERHLELALADLEKIASGEIALVGSDGTVVAPKPGDSGPEVVQRINMPMFSKSRSASVPIGFNSNLLKLP